MKTKIKHSNLSFSALIEKSIINGEGILTEHGALLVNTGKYTGRSSTDKFTVVDSISEQKIWWSAINQKISRRAAENLHKDIYNYLKKRDYFSQSIYTGGGDKYRIKIEALTERAWHSAFTRNMFFTPTLQELNNFIPDCTIFHAPGFKANLDKHNTNSEVAIVLDIKMRRILICGTEYAGEIKKSVFTYLSYLLPEKNVLPMHCSANKGTDKNTAIFFGLSGTGKTTLSSVKNRKLIGDDEHGWDDNGVFNLENGCYAKAIRLNQTDEPQIFSKTQQYGTILENVATVKQNTRQINLDDSSTTENTRASYSLDSFSGQFNELKENNTHPNHVIMLTCDAFGVLPPISKLNNKQAIYHFINGYTAKIAGTERNIQTPVAIFSACFGAPFMALKPNIYGELLKKKIEKYGSSCWLINTGWSGGPYGLGARIKIKLTRKLIKLILTGAIKKAKWKIAPVFDLQIPIELPNIPKKFLDPRESWKNPDQYDKKANELMELFKKNCAVFYSTNTLQKF